MEALGIFQTERHPSLMGIGVPKEGFSLYGTLSCECATPGGRRLMRSWFLRPLAELGPLNERLDAVAALAAAPEAVGGLRALLRKARH